MEDDSSDSNSKDETTGLLSGRCHWSYLIFTELFSFLLFFSTSHLDVGNGPIKKPAEEKSLELGRMVMYNTLIIVVLWCYKHKVFVSYVLLHVLYQVLCSFYPVRVCAAGLCVWSRRFVCVRTYVYIYIYMSTKKQAV